MQVRKDHGIPEGSEGSSAMTKQVTEELIHQVAGMLKTAGWHAKADRQWEGLRAVIQHIAQELTDEPPADLVSQLRAELLKYVRMHEDEWGADPSERPRALVALLGEPSATPGASTKGEDSVTPSAESSRPPELPCVWRAGCQAPERCKAEQRCLQVSLKVHPAIVQGAEFVLAEKSGANHVHLFEPVEGFLKCKCGELFTVQADVRLK